MPAEVTKRRVAIEAASAWESFMQAVIHVVEETSGIDLVHQYPAKDLPDAVDHLTVTLEAETACLTVTARKQYRSQGAAIFVADNTDVSTVAGALAENLRRHGADVVVIDDDDRVHEPAALDGTEVLEENVGDVPDDDVSDEASAEFPPRLRLVTRDKKPPRQKGERQPKNGRDEVPMAKKILGPVVGCLYGALLRVGLTITPEQSATVRAKYTNTSWYQSIHRLKEEGLLAPGDQRGAYTVKKVAYEIVESTGKTSVKNTAARRNGSPKRRVSAKATQKRRTSPKKDHELVVVAKTLPVHHGRGSSRQLVTAFTPLIQGARQAAQFIHALEEQHVTVTFEDGAVHLVIHPE